MTLFDLWGASEVGSAAYLRAAAYRLLRSVGAALSYEHMEGRNTFSIVLPAYILKDELSEELVRPVLAELQRRRALDGPTGPSRGGPKVYFACRQQPADFHSYSRD